MTAYSLGRKPQVIVPFNVGAREVGDSCSPLCGLATPFNMLTWGLRPRLYSFARFAGLCMLQE